MATNEELRKTGKFGLVPKELPVKPNTEIAKAFEAARTINAPQRAQAQAWAPAMPAPAIQAPALTLAEGPFRDNKINFNAAPEPVPIKATTSLGAAPPRSQLARITTTPVTSLLAGNPLNADLVAAGRAAPPMEMPTVATRAPAPTPSLTSMNQPGIDARNAQYAERAAYEAERARIENPRSMTRKELFEVRSGNTGTGKGRMQFAPPVPHHLNPRLIQSNAKAAAESAVFNAKSSIPVIQGPPAPPASPPPGGFGRARAALNRAIPSQPVGSGAVGQGLKSFAGGAAKLAGKLAAPVAIGIEGLDVARVAADPNASDIDVGTQFAQGAGRLGAAGAGAAGGAAWGVAGGPIGMAAGGLIGGLAGYYGADKAIEAGRRMVGADPSSPANRAPSLVEVPAQAEAMPAQPAQPFRDPRILGNPGTIAEQVTPVAPGVAPAPVAPPENANQINVTRQPNGTMAFSGGPNIGQNGGEISYNAGASGFRPGGFGVTSLGGKIAPSAESQATLTNPDGSRWTAQDSAVMAANMRDGIDPYRGTSRQTGQALTSFGQSGGVGLLGSDYRERRNAGVMQDSITATKGQREASAQDVQAIDARRLQGIKEGGDTARATMTDSTARRGQELSSETARRGQDMTAAGQIADAGIAKYRAGLEGQELDMRRTTAGFGDRAAARIESLQAAYAAAPDADKPGIAEQLRVMTGKSNPADWKGFSLQGSTDANGNKTEGVLAAVNERTGEVRRLDGAPQAAALPPGLVVGASTKQADGAYTVGSKTVTIKAGKVTEIK